MIAPAQAEPLSCFVVSLPGHGNGHVSDTVCLAWASYLITFVLNSPGAGLRRLIDSDFGVDKDLGSDPFRKAIV